ncbi:DUF4955 domain-containing protein [Hyunsoonleella pacifica]|uniref:DUF4955 domain-containing protein n=1 Tax=Hyunsoonleella pacifica TaxID=1080224 RepID=A0A4Q9FJF4_9FLAO|nr:DUF4955 domain-containing protein [Hyunsoonleella pacifica]TBN13072.1 DUF4955 domain-containing protein [Hyunsoonleella pacifica]GGD27353.1 hypothetical protein GCM10011368_31750 [Hyunsoonleella pacifica]
MNKRIIFYLATLIAGYINAQNVEAPSWVDFAEKKLTGNLAEATLNDFSYTGYHFSEKELPDVSGWNTISVTDYGAIPDDTGYDDLGIQSAIDAAEASNQPTVVFFPAGKYIVSSETTKTQPIVISGSNIVLKGAGTGVGGTEIYADKFNENKFGSGSTHYRFMFKPSNTDSNDITQVTAEIKKGDFEVQVASTANLSVGQYVDLFQKTTDNLEANMPGLTPNTRWTAINRDGIRPFEKHIITKISGNTVTFKNPVQLNMPVSSTTVLKTFQTIEEVGVEDILFTSGWKDYPENFVHHANDIVDYAWQALFFTNVVNGWIRNCHFKDWNEDIFVDRSMAVTVKNIDISGKRGHTSYYSRYSYGVLFENCFDNADEGLVDANKKGMHHGPGMRWSTTSSVFINCPMQPDQSIDCHGSHPYANLLDNIQGGKLLGNGGAELSYPNSGPYLTFWNFKHDANFTSRLYDFWFISNTTERRTHTFPNPLFVGFQPGPGENNIRFQNEGLDELHGQQVYPNSLLDAQLQLRLFGTYMSASSSKTNTEAKLANDDDDTTFWESDGAGTGEWLMLDLGINRTVKGITIKEVSSGIKDWTLEYWDNDQWVELVSDSEIGTEKTVNFDIIVTRKIRLNVVNMLAGQESASASITAFEIIPGPLELPADNFTIETIGETCTGKSNGSIIINANATYNYIASINGTNYNFTDTYTITDLAPGVYDLCITVEGEEFQQCYQVTIEIGVSLAAKIAVVKKSAQVSVESGAVPYSIYKNGKQIMETYQSKFSIDVTHGDELQIKSKDACQGEILKTINLLENIKAYPNPSNGLFEIYMPNNLKTVEIFIYNIHSQLIDVKMYTLNAGKLQLNIENKPNGIYFAKMNLEKPVFIKLIKK